MNTNIYIYDTNNTICNIHWIPRIFHKCVAPCSPSAPPLIAGALIQGLPDGLRQRVRRARVLLGMWSPVVMEGIWDLEQVEHI